jgi:hypothetical protein
MTRGKIFLILFSCLLSVSLSSLNRNQDFPKVAVCITGQVDRWIPEMHVKNLVEANKNVYFSFFFNFEFANRHHNTSYNFEFGIPSNFTHLSLKTSLHEISEMYTSDNAEFVNFKFELPYDMHKWQNIMGREGELLDRIGEYTSRQPIILNMYKNHISCMDSVLQYETQTQVKFDYVINSREDVYYFHPIDLRDTFEMLQNNSCGLVSKGCVMNYGINMRMQITGRDYAFKLFGTRLEFYKNMFQTGKTIKNPESFEMFHVNSLGLQSCTLPVDLFPIATARISPQGKYCFLLKELQSLTTVDHPSSIYSCIPQADYQKVLTMKCMDYPMAVKPPPPPVVKSATKYKISY